MAMPNGLPYGMPQHTHPTAAVLPAQMAWTAMQTAGFYQNQSGLPAHHRHSGMPVALPREAGLITHAAAPATLSAADIVISSDALDLRAEYRKRGAEPEPLGRPTTVTYEQSRLYRDDIFGSRITTNLPRQPAVTGGTSRISTSRDMAGGPGPVSLPSRVTKQRRVEWVGPESPHSRGTTPTLATVQHLPHTPVDSIRGRSSYGPNKGASKGAV
jgi:hypothetical protein